MCQYLKFAAFTDKNNDLPFNIKMKVFESALISSLLYGCETWLDGDMSPVTKIYNICVRILLGVRNLV